MILRCMIALYTHKYPVEIYKLGLEVSRKLPEGWYLRAQIHDSLVTIGPNSLYKEAQQIVGDVMAQPWKELDNLFIKVEHSYSGMGKSLGDCK